MKIEITWDGHWWKAHAANLTGYGRTIDGALEGLERRMERDGRARIVEPPELTFAAPGELGEVVARRWIALIELRKAQETCDAATRAAVVALSNAGISFGAIGIVLDLSKTRVHQLMALQRGESFNGVNERPTGEERSAE